VTPQIRSGVNSTAWGRSNHTRTDTGQGIVSHLIPVGSDAKRTLIETHAPEFVDWARGVQASRYSAFT